MTINLTFWLGLALLASVTANILAIWYIRVLLTKLMFVGENLSDLVDIITNYENHLKTIYGMEMYYGDETLKFLMEHTNSLLLVLEQYGDVYSIAEPIEEPEENTEEPTIEEMNNAETQIDQENVFYAGARRGDN
mgnify:FL=1|tara:strand:+ start:104 stop:508 length:405 start_codon:yes stop_codon:yes gene_type:complete